jgi:micrococcal nuclease
LKIRIFTEMISKFLHKVVFPVQVLVLFFTASGCNTLLNAGIGEAPALAESWAVVKVSDGDTLKVRQTNGEEMNVRLGCIDAPEKKQFLGKESQANLQRLVDEAGGWVMVSVISTDRYGRQVAEVFTAVSGIEKSLNEEQLVSGNAFFYKQYSDCPNRSVFERAEAMAKSKGIGVWSQSTVEYPWDYRARQRKR